MPHEARPPRANVRVGDGVPSMRSRLGLPLNDDRAEKSMRFQSRQALHDIQVNSLKSTGSPGRKRKSMSAKGGDGAQSGSSQEDKENNSAGGLFIIDENSSTPVKRAAPLLANFEEWMKMATDNKINAANSWNFALIDYFHDMSLLKEGNSVNFQKASCTLDGCVKIYTSRVDSVATETGRLLSGLADGSKNKQASGEDEEAGEGDGEGEDGEEGGKKKPKKRVQRSSEATLAPSFAQLQLKKMELEFSVDPLFKKASADFDEGGAKGLLLNHLTLDSNGRIVFDSSDDAAPEIKQTEADEAEDQTLNISGNELKSAPTDIATLAQRFFPDLSLLDRQDVCPSLKTFELGGGNDNSLDVPFLKASADDWKREHQRNADAMDIDDDDDGLGGLIMDDDADIGFGEGGEAWARQAAIDTRIRVSESNDNAEDGEGAEEAGFGGDGGMFGAAIQHGPTGAAENEHDNILAYFDATLAASKTNWAGPEHWRIRKIKDASSTLNTDQQAKRQTRKEKEPFAIDFLVPLTRAQHDLIYTTASTNSTICLPRSQWKCKSRNLLPDDKHFNSKQLLQLFLKPKARIGARRNYDASSSSQAFGPRRRDDEDEIKDTEMDGAFWARRQAEAAADQLESEQQIGGGVGDYNADFFSDQPLGGGMDLDDDDDAGFVDAAERLSPPADGGDTTTAIGDAGATTAFGTNLVTQSRRIRPEYVQYARVAKRVDVRRLKEEMWRGMGFKDSDAGANQDSRQDLDGGEKALAQPEAKSLKFTDVMNGLRTVYPRETLADISTSYCFICLLHLANEKGLALQGEENEFGEIEVRRDFNGASTVEELGEV